MAVICGAVFELLRWASRRLACISCFGSQRVYCASTLAKYIVTMSSGDARQFVVEVFCKNAGHANIMDISKDHSIQYVSCENKKDMRNLRCGPGHYLRKCLVLSAF